MIKKVDRIDTWEDMKSEKVCAIDIDDTIAASIPFFIEWMNKRLQKSFTDLDEIKNTIPYNQYRRLKKEYRTSGVKLNIPVIPGSSELTSGLKTLGYKIIIITARPANDYPELTKITNQWLRNNDIQYDGIIFDKHKHIKVLEQVPNLSFSINDHKTEANLLSKWGYTTFLIDNIYNQGEIGENVVRISKLSEILDHILEKGKI